MAACIPVKSKLIWLLVKKIIIVKNATAYTCDWYCHLVVDRASVRSVPTPNFFAKSNNLFGRLGNFLFSNPLDAKTDIAEYLAIESWGKV
jgi:hypothetical protein